MNADVRNVELLFPEPGEKLLELVAGRHLPAATGNPRSGGLGERKPVDLAHRIAGQGFHDGDLVRNLEGGEALKQVGA